MALPRPTHSIRKRRRRGAHLTGARRHPYNIHKGGMWMVKIMADNVHELRQKPADTEKNTINLGYVDLGHVDLMVQEGFYSNRTDFIRTAIRNQLERHADVIKQSTARKSLDLGLRNYSREDLEAARRAGEMLHINVLGLASIAQDVTPELKRRLPQSPCWELCMPVRRSRLLSPTRCGEADAGTGHSSRSHTPHARGPTRRSHRSPSAHASRRDRARRDIRHQRAHRSYRTRAANR